jgi:2-dehydro-3-deoxyphosphogluconate aldolase/(4S)-4-hydroxy-2-oxoglutarate aldolase
MKSKVLKTLEGNKVFAVVREKNPQKVIDISKAIIDGGIKTLEITTDCADSCGAISELSVIKNVIIGAGSIITSQQAQEGIQAGAKFLVTPVLEMSIVKFCKGRGIPLVTGASTANEAYSSWKVDNSIIKIFPAKAMGGPEYIRDILKAMPFLKLMPTSGIEIEDFLEYLKAGAVAVGIGKTLYYDAPDYKTITQRAAIVANKLEEYLQGQ